MLRGDDTITRGLTSPVELDHRRAPYLEALRAYAAREPGRFHVPGHKGGSGVDVELLEVLGERALQVDVPLIIPGIDVGPEPTPLQQARLLAADAFGAARTWFLTNGATQGNHAIFMAVAQLGGEIAVQRNAHASSIDGLVLSGLRPRFMGPELNAELGIAHGVTPQALELVLADSPDIAAAYVVSPTYFGAVADVAGLAEVAHAWDVPLIVDEAWGAHFPFHDALPADALSAGADLVLSGTHKLVGSLTQSAMLHQGPGGRIDESMIDRALTLVSSTSPSALLIGSLDAARRHAMLAGRELLDEAIGAVAEARAAIRAIPGLDALDDRLLRHAGVYDYDPLRLAIDVRDTGGTGFELAEILRERSDLHLELVSPNMLVALVGMTEPAREQCGRLVAALQAAVEELAARHADRRRRRRRITAPPRWGALAITPREAHFAPQERVPIAEAVGRVSAESLAAYPPGIPNVLPGERVTAATVDYIRAMLAQGCTIRGASDPSLQSIRVVTE
ncbi:MAG TPA: amino acid decarboxylase [Solirubrobacteraceae bacterium]